MIDEILKSRGMPRFEDYVAMNRSRGFIPSGFKELDDMVGGFPIGKITEVAGMPAVGKSMLMRYVCSNTDALYIDTENSFPAGVEYNFAWITDNILENVWGVVNDAVDSNEFKLIVVDSLAALVPLKELDDDTEPTMSTSMERSKLLTIWSRQLTNKLINSDCAVVFVNHLKQKVGVAYTDFYTPGGSSIPFVSSLRLQLFSTKSSLIKKDKEVVGQKIRIKVEKNRFGARAQECEIKFYYNLMNS